MATYGLPAWPWSGALVDDLPAPERLLADAFRLWSHEVARGAPSGSFALRMRKTAHSVFTIFSAHALLIRSLCSALSPHWKTVPSSKPVAEAAGIKFT